MKAAVEVKKLSVTYPKIKQAVVSDVSFSLPKGKILMIVGPNGSGKSTLVKAILGLVESRGQVQVFGHKVEQEYHQIGYLPQNFSFDTSFPITVEEFLNISLAECSCEECLRDPKNSIKKALTQVGAQKLLSSMMSELSGGQMQRVLLAKSIVHSPKLLILDEPEAGIDHAGEESIFSLVSQMVKESHMTAILVSHDLDYVKKYADLVLVINKKIISYGPVGSALSSQVIKKIYPHE